MGRRLIKRFWARRRLRWLTLLFLGFVILSGVGVEVTSQSWFCNSCHIMNSYHASWAAGTHKDVDCVKCHIAPGFTNLVSAKMNGLGQVVDDVLERTNTKPSASVSDFSCTREGCHTLAGGDRPLSILAGRYAAKYKFKFDHTKHLNVERFGVVMHCTTCHLHARGSAHFEVDTNLCMTCHLAYAPRWGGVPQPGGALPATQPDFSALGRVATQPDFATLSRLATQPADWAVAPQPAPPGQKIPPSNCETCHLVPQQPVLYRGLEVKHADFTAYKAPCESCHRGVTAAPARVESLQCFQCHDFGIERLTNATETHRVHSQGRHKVECFSCHGLISHGPNAQAARLDQIDCAACHRNEHGIEQKIYKFAEAPAHVPLDKTAVQPMFMAHVDCTACHIQLKPERNNPAGGALVLTATPKACDKCHKPGLGEYIDAEGVRRGLVPQWQEDTRRLHQLAESQLKRLTAAPDWPRAAPRARELAGEARQLLDLVRLDGSWGVHNPKYIEKLIHDARDRLAEAERLSSPSKAEGSAPATQPASGGP